MLRKPIKGLAAGILLCFFAMQDVRAAKKDSLAPKFDYARIGVDLSKFVASYIDDRYNSYEFTVDLHYKRDIYFVTDFGFGNSQVSNPQISYGSKNAFVRLGVDKTFFGKEFRGDMDNAFIGVRYGAGFVNRTAGTYFIKDTVWGNASGDVQKATFVAQWVELVGGFRMEILKNIFVGWNIRVKTFVNPKKFAELPPPYLAGYGQSEKNTAFGYNFYLLYGIGKNRN
nr:hypothetical protein [Chitinophagaceae bacterium]